ncbi:MAG: DnaD domain protein [Lachnospiraceae bacterium]|nr:DnaD domain protein [Lachnospiraceae bacterium]
MRIESVYPAGFIPVPYIFIDRYMCAANGEFVKTYLLLLRLAGEEGLTVSLLADRLEQTEKDVRRGLKYWEKEGLLAAEEKDGEIARLLLCYPGEPLPESFRKAEKAGGQAAEAAGKSGELKLSEQQLSAVKPQDAAVAEEPVVRSCSAARLQELRGQEDFGQLLFVVEHYLGRTLSSRDVDVFAYLYDDLGFSGEVLEYLVEYCVDIWEKKDKKKDYTIIRYLEQVALNWHKNGVRTPEEAKRQVKLFEQETLSYREVEKALGLKGRQLTEDERNFFFHWQYEEKLPQELILEACRRTVRRKGAFDQGYMKGILESWQQQGLKTLAEVEEADRRHAAQESAPKKKEKAKEKTAERRVDYDAALRDLFVQSIKYGSEE